MIATKPLASKVFETAFEQLISKLNAGTIDYQTRLEAFQQFQKIGLPTTRQDEWKFSDLARVEFNKLILPPARHVSLDKFKALCPDPSSLQAFIYYNGQLLEDNSSSLFSINRLRSQNDPVPLTYKTGLDALNRAFFQDGLDLVIPKNCIVQEPIYIIHIIESDQNPLLVNHKNVIRLEENSQATLIELYFSVGGTDSFSNTVTDIQLAKGSTLKHLLLQNPHQHFQISQTSIQQQEQSDYTGTVITKGGILNRAALQIEFQGSHALAKLFALALAEEQQKTDIHLTTQHQQPHCESETLSRSIVSGKARSSFTGKIIVKEGASKTKANLQNKNCLLSSTAEANTRPQLEIYNDDVQCSHGATVAHLEQEALFYIQSRGIPKEEAEALLIKGFIYPALAGIPPDCLNFIQRIIHES